MSLAHAGLRLTGHAHGGRLVRGRMEEVGRVEGLTWQEDGL